MRVAVIIQAFHPRIGGAERHLLQVAPHLQSRGVDLHVLTRRYSGLLPYEEVRGIPVHRLPIPGSRGSASISFTLSAQPLLWRLRPHVLHAHELLSPTTTAVLGKALLRCPVLVKILSGGELAALRRQPLGRRRLGVFLRRVDAFHVVSDEINDSLSELGIAGSRRVRIPNGVDSGHFRPPSIETRQAQRKALGLPPHAPVGVYTGRLSPEKGVRELVASWPLVRQVHPDALLVVVGDGADRRQLEQADGDGLRFVGPTGDVAPYLQAADVFALPSMTEGMSNSLLEAMAAGVPVVATAVGGTLQLTQGGRLAELVPPGDVRALGAALTRTLADGARSSGRSVEAREHVVRNFSIEESARRLAQAYSLLAAG